MKLFRLCVLGLLMMLPAAPPLFANDLLVETGAAARGDGAGAVRVEARVAWRNGWRNDRNHDAAWIVVKLGTSERPRWTHARLVSIDVTGGAPEARCEVTRDRVGAFCAARRAHRGDVDWTLAIEADAGGLADGAIEARVIGLEMVYVASGPFSIGDGDPCSVQYAAYYRSDAQGRHAGRYRVASEDAIPVAPEDGALYYQTRTPQYEGDQRGPVPAEFPKGTRAFYTMKYEILQGEYALFLDMLPDDATFFRAPFAGRGYEAGRGTIRREGSRYVAGRADRPANWISWDDGIAFADWMGLRPMTELEFTKAARGPGEPVPGDYPWGTTSKDRLRRRIGPDDELVRSGDADEARLTDETRDVLGASYYWVMDLAGSVWEKVVTPGHPAGRAFRGTHGDGVLGNYGRATNDDWPSGDHDGGGYGYRGGGYYERGMADRAFNPYSPTAWRSYGSWGGAPRSIAYGFRAVRTTGDVSSDGERRAAAAAEDTPVLSDVEPVRLAVLDYIDAIDLSFPFRIERRVVPGTTSGWARQQGGSDDRQIRVVLEDYVVGWREADTAKLAGVFAPEGSVMWVADEAGGERLETMTFADVLQRRRPQPDYGREWTIESLDVLDGQLAMAKLRISRAGGHYIDYLALHRIAGRWRVVNKTFVTR